MKLKDVLKTLPNWQSIVIILKTDEESTSRLSPSFSKNDIPTTLSDEYSSDAYTLAELANKKVAMMSVTMCDTIGIVVEF